MTAVGTIGLGAMPNPRPRFAGFYKWGILTPGCLKNHQSVVHKKWERRHLAFTLTCYLPQVSLSSLPLPPQVSLGDPATSPINPQCPWSPLLPSTRKPQCPFPQPAPVPVGGPTTLHQCPWAALLPSPQWIGFRPKGGPMFAIITKVMFCMTKYIWIQVWQTSCKSTDLSPGDRFPKHSQDCVVMGWSAGKTRQKGTNFKKAYW